MQMTFEEFAKKLKARPEYRLLTEQELRFHYNQARMMFPTPEPILIRCAVTHPTIYNRYYWDWETPSRFQVENVADAYNHGEYRGPWCGTIWDEYTELLCELMLHG